MTALCITSTAALSAGVQLPQSGSLEVAFSPRGGAQDLVLKVIQSSRKSIRLMGYSMTSAPVVGALIDAKKRNVYVTVVVDYDHNVGKQSRSAIAALNAMANAGIAVRTVDKFAIHHDKVIIVDGQHVQTGSFNYSASAEKSNSENVLVVWSNPALANTYIQHFDRNWSLGSPYQPGY